MNKIRNFCIIAHIDHGKSTLADRMIEITKTVEDRKMKAQLLDTMDIERERGITIKLQPVTMKCVEYILNLIDTPGHVDFTYEVSRSLAAVESAVLLVDSTQGIQAQTLANLYLAMEQDLMSLLGCLEEEIICTSGKTGQGVEDVLKAIIKNGKSPRHAKEDKKEPLRALIFDSNYDEYKGVVAYVRIMDGEIDNVLKELKTKL